MHYLKQIPLHPQNKTEQKNKQTKKTPQNSEKRCKALIIKRI